MSPLATGTLTARRAVIVGLVIGVSLAATGAGYSQLALPGAVAPTPEGTITAPGQPTKKKRVGGDEMGLARYAAVMPKAPSEDTIVGKTLKLDGEGSLIEFARNGADIQVAKLSLNGDRLSRSGESCKIEVAGMPLKLTPRDSATGLRRFQVEFPACPFSFDVLDGAILVTNAGAACELKAADCRTDPEGLWGMGTNDFDPKKAAETLGARAGVEKTVRGNFRALYDRNKKEKTIRDFVVREQAGFSSWREEICRSYAKESDVGYCALRLTEARAIALGAQLARGVKLPESVAPPAPPTANAPNAGPAPADAKKDGAVTKNDK